MRTIFACAALITAMIFNTSSSSACGFGPQISFTQPSPVAYTDAGANLSVQATIQFPNGFHTSCYVSMVINSWPYLFQNTLHNPQSSNGLSFHVLAPFWYTGMEYMTQFSALQNQTVTINIPITIPGNQLGRAAGTYQGTFVVQLKNMMGGTFQSHPLAITAHIQPSCTLPPPSVSSLDFSSAVHNGNIPAPVQRTLTFTNAGCTGPARLTLAAQPLTAPTIANAALHFTSTATLGASTVTLDTRNATSAFTVDASAPASGTIPLAVTLLPSSRFMPAGTYTSVLKVSLEPAQ